MPDLKPRPLPDLGPAQDPGDEGAPMDESETCDVVPVAVIPAEELADRAAALDGEIIQVVGAATTGTVRCTLRPCTMDDPCCNQCEAPLLVGGAEMIESGCFPAPGCVGTECGLECSPPRDVETRFVGVLHVGPPLTLKLLDAE